MTAVISFGAFAAILGAPPGAASVATRAPVAPRHLGNFTAIYKGAAKQGNLDCNGFSPVQKPLRPSLCTDVRGFLGTNNQNTWGGHFYDNGTYIGHDEPTTTFLSNQPGSGNTVNWNITLGKDPAAAPTVANPGKDVAHWVQLTPAPWVSMALCDGNSYPQMPCTPNSNSNAPSGSYPGGGSAFMEMQFYPPGNAPFVDNTSCNNTSWCAALTIDSLACTQGFAQCNSNCTEPVNFAFIQNNGVPTGPPAPQTATLATYNPNANTLMMNPGDNIQVQMADAPVPGHAGQKALKIVINDLTTGKSGYMQASAANGFQTTSITDCSGTPFNFQPEYSSASVGNYVPWAALRTDISTEFETGHSEACTTVTNPSTTNPFDAQDVGTPPLIAPSYSGCTGPYEAGGTEPSTTNPETSDAICYAQGDTHQGYNGLGTSTAPNIVSSCQSNVAQNGDLDFDGTPYWSEWPTSTNPTSLYPGSFVESLPTTTGGMPYPRLLFQTDVTLSESTCTPKGGCTVPPQGPGHFYPYWSEVRAANGTCKLEFGNVSKGAYTFGKDAQYGTVQWATLGYPETMSNVKDNTCAASPSQGYFLAGRSGKIVAGGDASSMAAVHAPPSAIVGVASTPSANGYYAVTKTGAVFTGGSAVFRGDLTTRYPQLHFSDIVGIVTTPNGGGYWLVSAQGNVFSFGSAKFYGSLVTRRLHLNNVVGMASSPTGKGYLLATATGRVINFGDAAWHGSLATGRANDIRGILLSATGGGYMLVAANGSVDRFGVMPFYGSLPRRHITVSDIVGIAAPSQHDGYWMVGSNGAVYAFGGAKPIVTTVPRSALPITAIAGATVNNGQGPAL
ncbi:MAG: hypothetical protein ACYDGN_06810 [Acidimicrobiales bacterium]